MARLSTHKNLTSPLHSPPLVSYLSLLLLSFICFAPVLLSTDFIWDDFVLLRSNVLGAPGGLRIIWFEPGRLGGEEHYWPMTYTLFHLQRLLWGMDVVMHHVTNVGFHAANACLLLSLLQRAFVPAPWLAAAIFAVHPVHVESVAWVIELKDVLSAFFYLLAALFYIRFTDSSHYPLVLGSLLCFVLALFSKSIAVTLPVGLMLLLWYNRNLVVRREAIWLGTMLCIGAAITAADLAFVTTGQSLGFQLTVHERAVIICKNLGLYLWKVFLPVQLQPIYPRWSTAVDAPVLLLGSAIILGTVMLYLLRNRLRGTAAAMAFFVVTLSPVLGAIKFSYMKFSFTADRFQYLASIGPICLVAGGLMKLRNHPRTRSLFLPITAALLITCSAATILYSNKYTSEEKLFRYNLKHNSESEIAHTRLGIIYSGRGNFGAALPHFKKSAELSPRDAGTHYNVGFAALQVGDRAEAERALQTALRLRSDYPKAVELLKQVRQTSAVQK